MVNVRELALEKYS